MSVTGLAKTVRTGLEASRAAYIPAAGEFVYSTDGKVTAIGDGLTAGGLPFAYANNPTFTGTVDAPTPDTTDNSTKVATTAMVQAVLASMLQNVVLFKGTVDASKASAAAAGVSGVPASGWQYRVTVAGAIAFGFQCNIGDWVVYDGAAWQHIDGAAGAITSTDGLLTIVQTGPGTFTLAINTIPLTHGGAGADLSALADGVLLKKVGNALVPAVAGTDYLAPGSAISGGTF